MAMLMRRLRAGQFTVPGFRSSFRDWAAETAVVFEVAEHRWFASVGRVDCLVRADIDIGRIRR